MRPMRLFKREIKDEEILREILEECDVVRLGGFDEDGMFIVPVNYGYELENISGKMNLRLYIHGAKEGRKAEAFAKNASVAVEMDCCHEVITGDYTCSYSYAYRSIMGNGRIHVLTEKEKQIHALTKIMEHLAPDAEIRFRPEMLERTAVFCIDVEDFTGKERKKK